MLRDRSVRSPWRTPADPVRCRVTMTLSRRTAALLLPLAATAALAGCEATDTESTSSSSSSASSGGGGDDGSKASCGFKATDDCTPRVSGRSKVQVDTIQYRVSGASTASEIGDASSGLGQKANGAFVSVKVSARNGKDGSVTLTDVFKLEVNGKTYDPDIEGTTAALGAGDQPFFLDDIGPDVTQRGLVVFDVPKSALTKKLELRLGELGLGSTKAYIRLPKLSS